MVWKRRRVVIGAIALGAIVAIGIGWLAAERDARNVERQVEQRIGEGSKASCATEEIGEELAKSWMCTVEFEGISDLCLVELDERDRIVSSRGLVDELAEAAGVPEARSSLCAKIIGGSGESSSSALLDVAFNAVQENPFAPAGNRRSVERPAALETDSLISVGIVCSRASRLFKPAIARWRLG